jgi:hypothetical protein
MYMFMYMGMYMFLKSHFKSISSSNGLVGRQYARLGEISQILEMNLSQFFKIRTKSSILFCQIFDSVNNE